MPKIVINKCFGGFSLSEAAYEKLIEWGIPVRRHVKETRGSDGLYNRPTENDGEVIFDRDLDGPDVDNLSKGLRSLSGRYWDTWLDHQRDHPLLVRVVEELGAGHRTGASGRYADLKVVEIPDGVEWEISEYDGCEHIAQKHETWS